jgi:cyclophilin family peptidyl-prolyl cis-trans isomerase
LNIILLLGSLSRFLFQNNRKNFLSMTIGLSSFQALSVFIAFALVLPFTACQQNQAPEAPPEPELTDLQKRQLQLEEVKLTDSTVAEFLTGYGKENPETMVLIQTNMGDIKVRLYEETPLHRANFIRLAKGGFYDGAEFYRVLEDFMIQGGDYEKRKINIGRYRIPEEMDPSLIHKRGALAMARYEENNPENRSSSHNFFIVQGKELSRLDVQAFAQESGIKYTPEQIRTYTTLGGEPGLDQVYTVFGEVVEGLDVVEKISKVEVDAQKWPLKPVTMKMKVLE